MANIGVALDAIGRADAAAADVPAPPAPPARGQSDHPLDRADRVSTTDPDARVLPVDAIQLRGPYVRQHFHALAYEQLLADVRAHGVQTPIGVRQTVEDGRTIYVLVYGSRRLRAAREAGHATVPVRMLGRLTEEKALEAQIRENDQRADPHAVDTAFAYAALRDRGYTKAQIAAVAGRSPGLLTYYLGAADLLQDLPAETRERLYTPAVSFRALRTILAAPGSDEERRAAVLALASRPIEDDAADPEAAAPAATARPTPTPPHPRGPRGRRQVFDVRASRGGMAGEYRLRFDARRVGSDPTGAVRQLSGHLDHLLADWAARVTRALRDHTPDADRATALVQAVEQEVAALRQRLSGDAASA